MFCLSLSVLFYYFMCANSVAVGKVKGSVIHNFLIFFVTQFVVSSWHLKVTMPVGPS